MRAELIPINGGPPIPITRDITVIGRREYCDIQLNDPSLSKRHCVLVKTDGLLMIRDLATTNGTRVKGQMIRWAALLPNDKIVIGKLRFRVYLGPDGSTSDTATKPTKAKPAKPKSRPAKATPPAPRPPIPVPIPVAAPRLPELDNDRPPLDLDDPHWFDRIQSDDDLVEEIIDLD